MSTSPILVPLLCITLVLVLALRLSFAYSPKPCPDHFNDPAGVAVPVPAFANTLVLCV